MFNVYVYVQVTLKVNVTCAFTLRKRTKVRIANRSLRGIVKPADAYPHAKHSESESESEVGVFAFVFVFEYSALIPRNRRLAF